MLQYDLIFPVYGCYSRYRNISIIRDFYLSIVEVVITFLCIYKLIFSFSTQFEDHL